MNPDTLLSQPGSNSFNQALFCLQNLVDTSKQEDNTEQIRALKHSSLMREEADRLVALRNEGILDLEVLSLQCQFLYFYYSDIFNKIRKDVLDISILHRLIDVLEKIENETIDHHKGCDEAKEILIEMIHDSSLRNSRKLDEAAATATANANANASPHSGNQENENENGKQEEEEQGLAISWQAFKHQHLDKTSLFNRPTISNTTTNTVAPPPHSDLTKKQLKKQAKKQAKKWAKKQR